MALFFNTMCFYITLMTHFLNYFWNLLIIVPVLLLIIKIFRLNMFDNNLIFSSTDDSTHFIYNRKYLLFTSFTSFIFVIVMYIESRLFNLKLSNQFLPVLKANLIFIVLFFILLWIAHSLNKMKNK